MRDNERPIVFTITEYVKSVAGSTYCYDITTKDPRGESENLTEIPTESPFLYMELISARLNNKGYAVLFEVD